MLCLVIIPLSGLSDRRNGNLANTGLDFARSTDLRLLARGVVYSGR